MNSQALTSLWDHQERIGVDEHQRPIWEIGPHRKRYFEVSDDEGVLYIPDMKNGHRYAVPSLDAALSHERYGLLRSLVEAQEKPLSDLIKAHGAELEEITGRGHYYLVRGADGDALACIRVLKDHRQVEGGGFDLHSGERGGEADIDIHYEVADSLISVDTSADLDPYFQPLAQAIAKAYEGKHLTEMLEQPPSSPAEETNSPSP
jgi:hypothetical protein